MIYNPFYNIYNSFDDHQYKQVLVKSEEISDYTYEQLFELAKVNVVNVFISTGIDRYVNIKFVESITVEDYLLSEHYTKKEIEANVQIKLYDMVIGMLDTEMRFLNEIKKTHNFTKRKKNIFKKIASFLTKTKP